jgi:dTDP-4-amino-4,6-dideoxygalactose transaminase
MSNFDNIQNIKKNIKEKIKYIVKKLDNNKYISFQHLFSKTWFSLKVLIISNKSINFQKLFKKIKSNNKVGIYKAWSSKPMHQHKIFKKFKKMPLNNTNDIEKRLFCIPFNIGYKKNELNRLVRSINSNF